MALEVKEAPVLPSIPHLELASLSAEAWNRIAQSSALGKNC